MSYELFHYESLFLLFFLDYTVWALLEGFVDVEGFVDGGVTDLSGLDLTDSGVTGREGRLESPSTDGDLYGYGASGYFGVILSLELT